ncbi:MAG TPA: response regulator transcription factor [Syntrophales bacterium]|nr:response regulator transcription factor [Syntrophales bacterium]HQB30320.1 response regulator transcription factor [Syntrophales bacterium]HQN78285.1 response regulator transcription factor [Syntrophales bacterium]HQQ27915.1 response regulator transcription factor [Syntrophales bacterium]
MSIAVFLADDHTIVRDGLRSLLEAHGDMKIVGEAANGRDAVRAVRKLKPDVVIMDILMADLNGIEATEQICRECPATRVVILSMQSSSESILRALRAGARGYLFKESAGRELIQAIHAVRAGHRYLSAKVSDQVVGAFLKQEEPYRDPLSVLSRREREVLQLVVEGRTSAEIAGTLFLSVKTVETYRSRLMKKLGIGDIPGLIKFAIQHGLTSLE